MKPRQRNTVRIGALELNFHVDETLSASDMVAFEFVVPPAAKVPAAHYHVSVDELVYGLEGTITTTVDGVAHEIGPGQSRFIRRGCVHIHENRHPQTARALVVMTPGSIGRAYFEEIAAAIAGAGPPDIGKIKEIMLRYGLVPV